MRVPTNVHRFFRTPCASLLLFAISWQIALAQNGVYQCPQYLNLDRFYVKYADASGIPVVASGKVSNAALLEAKTIVNAMLAKRPDIRDELMRHKVRVAVMSEHEQTLDIPEHADLNRVFPPTDWNKRARGVGATDERPVCTCGEENLLGLAGDRYKGEGILIHEFGHTMLEMGIDKKDPHFRERLTAAYKQAIANGKWKNTYAGSNVNEYWAEGVQDWFDCNLHRTPPDGIHNEIHTRAQLLQYDPQLAYLIREVFPTEWRWQPK